MSKYPLSTHSSGNHHRPDPERAANTDTGDEPERDGLQLAHTLGSIHRHRGLVVAIVLSAVALGALFRATSRPQYRATAVVRVSSERQAVAGGVENAEPALSRSADPLLSIIQLQRSRTVIGQVVDSLGLRLQPLAQRIALGRFRLGRSLGSEYLTDARVAPGAPADTVYLQFRDSTVWAESSAGDTTVDYGEPVQFPDITFTIPRRPNAGSAEIAVLPRDEAIDRVLSLLSVSSRAGTDVFEVHAVDPDPVRAQQVANLAVITFQEANVRSAQELAQRRGVFLSAQLKKTDGLLADARHALIRFLQQQRYSSASAGMAEEQAALGALTARRAELTADRQVFSSLLDQIQSPDDSVRGDALRSLAYAPEVAADPRITRVYQQILVYRTRLDSLTTGRFRSADSDPDVVQLRSLLASTQQELAFALRGRINSLKERSTALASIGASSRASIRSLPAAEAVEGELRSRVRSLSDLHDEIDRDLTKASMAQAVEAGSVDIVDLAPVPYIPDLPPWWLVVLVSGLIGLVLATAVALYVERGHSLHRPEEASRFLDLPELAVIPPVDEFPAALAADGANPALPGRNGHQQFPSGAGEAFRVLRSGLLLSESIDATHRSIAVTSSLPGEGKTLIALNLAASFAEEGRHVLLVDFDLRAGRLHSVFGVAREPGLVDFLKTRKDWPAVASPGAPKSSWAFLPDVEELARERGERTGERVTPRVHRTSIKGLDFLTSGTRPRNPASIVTETRMRRFVEDAAQHYDLLVLDLPPVLATADAVILSAMVDGVVFVFCAGRTDREAADRARQQLDRVKAKLLGVVLNDPKGSIPGFGQYYYPYGYGDPHADVRR